MSIYNLPGLNHEELEDLNRQTSSGEIETTMKNLLKNRSPGPDGFTSEFYQTFKDNFKLPLLKFSQKTKEEAILPNTFCEANIILIQKAGKDNTQ